MTTDTKTVITSVSACPPDQLPSVVAEWRRKRAGLKAMLDAERLKFEKDNSYLIDMVKLADEHTGEAEDALRAAALAMYEANPQERRPLPGTEVKVFLDVAYDTEQALEWAKAHGMALLLDKRAFELVAKNVSLRPDCVVVTQVPRVQLATDMDKVIAKGTKE